MEDVSIVGLDLAKRVFQVHGATSDGRAVTVRFGSTSLISTVGRRSSVTAVSANASRVFGSGCPSTNLLRSAAIMCRLHVVARFPIAPQQSPIQSA